VATTAAEFAAIVNERVASGVPAAQQTARERLESEGWAEKAQLFERWLDG
jgi:hypothetical protein